MAKKQSRADRYQLSVDKISESKSEMEILRDELQEWLDNMPENLQESQKAEELQGAIEELDNVIGLIEEIESTNIGFPGMI